MSDEDLMNALESAGEELGHIEADRDELRAELQRALAREEGNLIAARALVEVRDALQERVTVLETALRGLEGKLSRPKGMHSYVRGIHATPCEACETLATVRRALAGTGEGATGCACSPGDQCSCHYGCECREQCWRELRAMRA